jgi:TPR repeat protein
LYSQGLGVEKDVKRELYHLEEAAVGGHPSARYILGCNEIANGNNERAVKHLIIATKLGYDDALDAVKAGFAEGIVSKEVHDTAILGYQAAIDATKSKQREEAYSNTLIQSPYSTRT